MMPIEYTFSPEILEEDRTVILESSLFQTWLVRSQKKFAVSKIHFSSVVFRQKKQRIYAVGSILCRVLPV